MTATQPIVQSQETNAIYTPPGSVHLDNYLDLQLRVGLQGYPKTGKTFSGMSFPNPIAISFDRGLISHVGRSDIIEMPFYDGKFVDSIIKRDGILCPPNRKEALILWLSNDGQKLTKNQTLIIDGGTGIQASYHVWYRQNPAITTNGAEDKFAQWRLKADYFAEIMILLKSLKCSVVYITHESADRDAKGELNGQVRPLLTGQFVDELASHFTDWYRCLTVAKPSPEKVQDFKNKFILNEADYKEWIASTTTQTIYLWQTQSDELAKCGTSLIGAPKYILANYSQFNKYKKKI